MNENITHLTDEEFMDGKSGIIYVPYVFKTVKTKVNNTTVWHSNKLINLLLKVNHPFTAKLMNGLLCDLKRNYILLLSEWYRKTTSTIQEPFMHKQVPLLVCLKIFFVLDFYDKKQFICQPKTSQRTHF